MNKTILILLFVILLSGQAFAGQVYVDPLDGQVKSLPSTLQGNTDDQTAAEVAVTPAGDIAADDVQAAIEELDGEKAAGPASSTATSVPVFSDDSGKVLIETPVKIDAEGNMTGVGSVSMGSASVTASNLASPQIGKAPAAVTSFAGTVSSSSTTVTFSSAADAVLAGYKAANPILGTTIIAGAQTRYITAWTNSTTCTVGVAPSAAWSATAITSVQHPQIFGVTSAGVLSWFVSAAGQFFVVGNLLDVNGDFRITDVNTFWNLNLKKGVAASYSEDQAAIFTTAGGESGMYQGYGALVIAGRNNGGTGGNIYLATQDTGVAQEPRLTVHYLGNIGIGYIYPLDRFVSLNTSGLGAESLSETAFTTHALWDVTGDFTDSTGAAVYTHSTTSGTLTQPSASLATAINPNRYYKLAYTVSGVTAGCTASITTAISSASTALTLTAGAQTTYFKSAASPGDFVISVTSTAGGFTLDDISLKEVTGGDANIGGTVIGNAGWFSNDVSALSFTDRTPYFEGNALPLVKAIKGKDGEIDHKTLPEFAQRTIAVSSISDGDEVPVAEAFESIDKIKADVRFDEATGKYYKQVEKKSDVPGRDLGAMISILTKAVQELSAEVDALKAAK